MFVAIWAQLGPKIEENMSVNKKKEKKNAAAEAAASSHAHTNKVFVRKKKPISSAEMAMAR